MSQVTCCGKNDIYYDVLVCVSLLALSNDRVNVNVVNGGSIKPGFIHRLGWREETSVGERSEHNVL
jgi:hypothetical protein